jgi:DNA topoisomerase-1
MRGMINSMPDLPEVEGLTYSSDDRPGWTRRRRGRGFSYLDTRGNLIRDPAARRRIESLVIPPAWTDVWICPRASGHIQVTGRDDRGRKQYIYHSLWREGRDTAKYASLPGFGASLPRLRRRLARDLAAGTGTLDRRTVTAALVSLLDLTLIRVGNSRYATDNGSYGLTTLQGEHVEVSGDDLRFAFVGKSGKEHEISLRNRRLAAIVRHCQELPGQDLFQFENEAGEPQVVRSDDVNAYLRESVGEQHSAKDFRTWAATVMTAQQLHGMGGAASTSAAKRNVTTAVRATAERLGNTLAVCRRSYVHPVVLGTYLAGDFVERFSSALESARGERTEGLRVGEAATLRFLTEEDPA